MPDYQKSKIYKLYSPSKNLTYIGSTTETLAQRLAKHKSSHKAYKNDNTKTCYSSFLVLDCEDYKIELLEEYACNNKTQLEKKEGEYIKNNECCNEKIAGRTIAEYYTDNADKLKEKQKQFYKENTDRVKEQQKRFYTDNAEKIKERKRQYYLNKKLEQKI